MDVKRNPENRIWVLETNQVLQQMKFKFIFLTFSSRKLCKSYQMSG